MAALPNAKVEIGGGEIGDLYYLAGGPKQESPVFTRAVGGGFFQSRTDYVIYVENVDLQSNIEAYPFHFDEFGSVVPGLVANNPAVPDAGNIEHTGARITFQGGGPGWFYALEGGAEQASPTFLFDKDGNLFKSGILYQAYAYHPDLQPIENALLFQFRFDDAGNAIFVNKPEPDPSDPNTPAFNYNGVIDGYRLEYKIINGRPTIIAVPRDTMDDTSLRLNLSGNVYASDAVMVRYPHFTPTGEIDGFILRPMLMARMAEYAFANIALEYIALMLHSGREFLTLDSVVGYGEQIGSPGTNKAIRLLENANVVLYWNATSKGMFWLPRDAAPLDTPLAFMGFTDAGYLTMSVNQRQQLQVRDDRILINRLLQGDVPAYLRELGTSILQVSDKVTLPTVQEFSPTLNEYIFKQQTAEAFGQTILEHIPLPELAAKLDEYNTLGSEQWVVDSVCYYDEEIPAPVLTEYEATVTAGVTGDPVLHPLATASFTFQCFAAMGNMFRPDSNVEVTNAENSTTQVRFYNPGSAPWTGKIKFWKIAA